MFSWLRKGRSGSATKISLFANAILVTMIVLGYRSFTAHLSSALTTQTRQHASLYRNIVQGAGESGPNAEQKLATERLMAAKAALEMSASQAHMLRTQYDDLQTKFTAQQKEIQRAQTAAAKAVSNAETSQTESGKAEELRKWSIKERTEQKVKICQPSS